MDNFVKYKSQIYPNNLEMNMENLRNAIKNTPHLQTDEKLLILFGQSVGIPTDHQKQADLEIIHEIFSNANWVSLPRGTAPNRQEPSRKRSGSDVPDSPNTITFQDEIQKKRICLQTSIYQRKEYILLVHLNTALVNYTKASVAEP